MSTRNICHRTSELHYKTISIQSNLRTTAMHGDEPFGLCREFDLISEFFGLDEDLVDPE